MVPNAPDSNPEFTRGLMLHMAQDFEAAKDVWYKILARNPKDWGAKGQLGLAVHWSGDTASGEQLVREAMSLAPDEPAPLFHLATILTESGRRNEAVRTLDLAAMKTEHATHVRPLLLSMLGSFEEYGRANKWADIWSAGDLDDPALMSEIAISLLYKDELKRSRELAHRAWEAGGGTLEALRALGAVGIVSRDKDLAQWALDRGAALEPIVAEPTFQLWGDIAARHRLYDAAAKLFGSIFEANPANTNAQMRAARYYILCGDLITARKFLEDDAQLEANPDLMVERARLEDEEGNRAAAIEWSEKALARQPDSMPAFFFLAERDIDPGAMLDTGLWESLRDQANLPTRGRADIAKCLARVFELRGDEERAKTNLAIYEKVWAKFQSEFPAVGQPGN